MVANVLPIYLLLGVGSKRQNSTFSEHGHVAYQIKGNDECINMQAHILSLQAPSIPMVGSNVVFFIFKEVMLLYQINWHRAPCKHILCPNTCHWPLGRGQKIKIFFLKVSCHVAYQIKGNIA